MSAFLGMPPNWPEEYEMNETENEKTNHFEKLHIIGENENKYMSIAVANCPDDWNLCSIVLTDRWKYYHSGLDNVSHALFTKDQAIQIRDAIDQVISDIPTQGKE